MPVRENLGLSPAARNPARDRLIQSAIRFFGERGISVPMVEISAAAGHRNKSAITYHFDGKEGLIDAIYAEIQTFLEPRFELLLMALERKQTKGLTLYEIGLSLNAPFFALYSSEPGGNSALKALARLGHDSPPGEESMYRRFLTETFSRFAALIIKTTPLKPRGQLNFHLMHYLMATVNGLALIDHWQEADFRSDPELMFELLLSYTDYITGGLGAFEANRPTIDADHWRAAIRP
jgi:AcrR family transcriptional regulator